MSINFGLYSLVILIPIAFGLWLHAMSFKRKQRALFVVLTIILILSPSWWVRFAPQLAWEQEAFIPCSGFAAINNDTFVIGGGGHPVYVLRRKENRWEREVTFVGARRGAAVEVSIGDPDEYGNTIEDCADIHKNNKNFHPFFGAVAVSDNAVFFVSVGPQLDGIGTGTIYTSVYEGNSWSDPQPLPSLPGDRFNNIGYTLDVSGNTLVSGNENVVYVYEKDARTQQWIFAERIPDAGNGYSLEFGSPIAIDKDRIVVGAKPYSSGAYVFARYANSEKWVLEDTLHPNLANRDSSRVNSAARFGKGVDIQGDTIAVGAYGLNFPDGIVYIYQRNKSTNAWERVDTLKPVGGRSFWNIERYFLRYGFGANVEIDGDTIAVSTGASEKGIDSGGIFTYTRRASEGHWHQQAIFNKNVSSDNSYFGNSAYISKNTLVISGRSGSSIGFHILRSR